MIKNPTFGSDAEFFVRSLEGHLIPACGMIGGTKDKPRQLGGGYAVQEDNVLVEYNIPPAKDHDEFLHYISVGLEKARAELPAAFVVDDGSSHSFPAAYINGIHQASVFGCDPDYNAWTMAQNNKPHAEDAFFRTASAHIHIGWENPTSEDMIALIRWADVFVVLPSLFESADRARRKLYGRAGAFRPKDYGVEHRVLDNYWIFNPHYTTQVYMRYLSAIAMVNQNKQFDKKDEPRLFAAINDYDLMAAKNLMNKYGAI